MSMRGAFLRTLENSPMAFLYESHASGWPALRYWRNCACTTLEVDMSVSGLRVSIRREMSVAVLICSP